MRKPSPPPQRPFANRRSVFLRPLFWLMPWLFLLAAGGSLIDVFRTPYVSTASWQEYFERGPDGVLVRALPTGGGRSIFEPSGPQTPAPPALIGGSLEIGHASSRRQMWFQFGSAWWSRMEWRLDVTPDASLPPPTAADRAQIATVLFPLCREEVPDGVSELPAPGETTVVGHVTDVDYGLLAVWLLSGAPGVVLIAWFLTGFALWVSRNSGHKWMLCGGCGYNRTGLTKETPCPECGAGGMHAVCPECGKAP